LASRCDSCDTRLVPGHRLQPSPHRSSTSPSPRAEIIWRQGKHNSLAPGPSLSHKTILADIPHKAATLGSSGPQAWTTKPPKLLILSYCRPCPHFPAMSRPLLTMSAPTRRSKAIATTPCAHNAHIRSTQPAAHNPHTEAPTSEAPTSEAPTSEAPSQLPVRRSHRSQCAQAAAAHICHCLLLPAHTMHQSCWPHHRSAHAVRLDSSLWQTPCTQQQSNTVQVLAVAHSTASRAGHGLPGCSSEGGSAPQNSRWQQPAQACRLAWRAAQSEKQAGLKESLSPGPLW
jgi:hypothetical protein